jgi:hypothetical protein
VTQEQMALLLGVRRESVTLAAGVLQKSGVISYARGSITVVERKEIEARSCECYAAVRDECAHLLPHAQVPKAAS